MLRVSSAMDNSLSALSGRLCLPPLRSLDPLDRQQLLLHGDSQLNAAWHPPHAGVSPTARHVLFHPYRRPQSDPQPQLAMATASSRGGRLPGIASLLNRLTDDELTPPPRSTAAVRPLPATSGDRASNKRRRLEQGERAKAEDSRVGPKKPSRYLREMDRRNILQRLSNGEKQADLAKEFNVSRAAICNLNKHRNAVLSRQNEHPLAKHPKRRGYKKAKRPTATATAAAAADKC